MTELQVTNGQVLTKGQHTSSYKFTCQDCIWFLGSESELAVVDRINMVPAAITVVLCGREDLVGRWKEGRKEGRKKGRKEGRNEEMKK